MFFENYNADALFVVEYSNRYASKSSAAGCYTGVKTLIITAMTRLNRD